MAHTTLADVANHAKVSKSMVSLVLSGKGANRCAPETAERIRMAAAALGYKPNKVAQSLRQQSTNMLGMISVEVATTPYAGELILANRPKPLCEAGQAELGTEQMVHSHLWLS